MNNNDHRDLSRRERQILDILYQRGQATAAEVQTELPEPPSYSAVPALLSHDIHLVTASLRRASASARQFVWTLGLLTRVDPVVARRSE